MFEFLKRNEGKIINANDMDSLIGKAELIDIREKYEKSCKYEVYK